MEDTAVVIKKVRKSRAKAAVAHDAIDTPPRSLEQLENVQFQDMTSEELRTVATTLATQVQRVQGMLSKLEQDNKVITRQNEKMLATMAYIRQTMDHANTSILLQIGACSND